MTWRHRIDADALPVHWPSLIDSAPAMDDFVRRDAAVTLDLQPADARDIRELAARFDSTEAGVVLQAIMVFVYGRYLLVRMRRDRAGLFKGMSGDDPASFSLSGSAAGNPMQLEVPHRLLIDLDALARRQSITASALAGMALNRFMSGHLDPGSRIGMLDPR